MKNLDFSVIAPYMTLLPAAIKMVLTIGLCAFVLASLLAVVVGNLRSRPRWKPLEVLLGFYVEFFRGTPLMEVSESTLYPILRRLETGGCVSTFSQEHSGRLRKYYRLEPPGMEKIRQFLDEAEEMRRIYQYIEEESR